MILSLVLKDDSPDWSIKFEDGDILYDFISTRGTLPLAHMMIFALDKIATMYETKGQDRLKVLDRLMEAFGEAIMNPKSSSEIKL